MRSLRYGPASGNGALRKHRPVITACGAGKAIYCKGLIRGFAEYVVPEAFRLKIVPDSMLIRSASDLVI